MPYAMSLFPSERARHPVPKVGDEFVVVEVTEGAMDIHWGKHAYVRLQRIPAHTAPKLADSLFIRTDLAEAYKAYAESLGRSVESLSIQEKKQAALNAILGAGKDEP